MPTVPPQAIHEIEWQGRKVRVAGRSIIINFKREVGEEDRINLFRQFRLQVMSFIPPRNYNVLPPADVDLGALVDEISKSPRVSSVGPNVLIDVQNQSVHDPNNSRYPLRFKGSDNVAPAQSAGIVPLMEELSRDPLVRQIDPDYVGIQSSDSRRPLLRSGAATGCWGAVATT